MNFAIPGLQNPTVATKDSVRISSEDTGTINLKVYGPIRNSLAKPRFEIYIERADSRDNYKLLFSDDKGKYVFPTPINDSYVEYYFKLSYKEFILDKGNYKVTVYVNDTITIHWLTVKYTPKYGEISQDEYTFVQCYGDLPQFGYKELTSFTYVTVHTTIQFSGGLTVEDHYGELITFKRAIGITTDVALTRERFIYCTATVNISDNHLLVREKALNSSNSISLAGSAIVAKELFITSTTPINVGSVSKLNVERCLTSTLTIGNTRTDALLGEPTIKVLEGSANIEITQQSETVKGHTYDLQSLSSITIAPTTRLRIWEPTIKELECQVRPIWVLTYTTLDVRHPRTVKLKGDTTTRITTTSDLTIAPSTEVATTNDIIISTTSTIIRERLLNVDSNVSILTQVDVVRERNINASSNIIIDQVSEAVTGHTYELEVNQVIGITPITTLIKGVFPSATITVTSDMICGPVIILEKVTTIVEDWPTAMEYNPATNELLVINSKSNSLSLIDADSGVNLTPTAINLEYSDTKTVSNWILNSSDPVKAVITGHNILDGDTVYLHNIDGTINTELLNNNYFTVTVVDANTVSLDGTNSLNFINLIDGYLDVVEDFPFSISYATVEEKFAICNRDTNSVTILDSTYNKLDIIELGVGPEKIIYLENLARWAVICLESDLLFLIDANNHALVNPLGIILGDAPIDIAYNPNDQRLGVITQLDDNVHIIDATTGTILNSMSVTDFPTSITYIEALDEFIVTNVNSHNITRINSSSANIVGSVQVGNGPCDVAYSTVNNTLAVTNKFSHTVTIIDCTDWSIVTTIPVGYTPSEIIYIAYNNLFVTRNIQDDTLSIISAQTNTVIKVVAVEQNPTALFYCEEEKKLLVCNRDSDTVTLLDIRFFDN